MTPLVPQPSRTKRLSHHPLLPLSTILLCLVFVRFHHPLHQTPHYRLVPYTQAFQTTTTPAFTVKRRRTPHEWHCDTARVTPFRASVDDIRENTATATIELPVPLSPTQTDNERWSEDASSELLILSTDSTSSPTAHTNGKQKDGDANHTSSPSTSTPTTTTTATTNNNNQTPEPNEADTPHPTSNGGFTHTRSSRAKISAANKGKVPWNKGRTRSPEEKARISAGVRKKNRERHLQKLADLGYTEAEWEAKKKEERRERDAERRKRRTEKGGYRPTKETKEKISRILKEKHKNGEIKKRVYNGPFRKGFKHSEETKEKIRASLRKKWAEDPDYQAKMRGANSHVSSASVRQKISNTLKQKWQDPKFRDKMLESIKTRKPNGANGDTRLRSEKISETMKRKWLDLEYRKKAMDGMAKHRSSLTPKPPKVKVAGKKKKVVKKKVRKKVKRDDEDDSGDLMVVMASTVAEVNAAKKREAVEKIAEQKAALQEGDGEVVKIDSEDIYNRVDGVALGDTKVVKPKKTPAKKRKKNTGDISVMREERRDLYDLLYGDDVESKSEVGDGGYGTDDNEYDGFGGGSNNIAFKKDLFSSQLDDENLDTFDPYGLEDF